MLNYRDHTICEEGLSNEDIEALCKEIDREIAMEEYDNLMKRMVNALPTYVSGSFCDKNPRKDYKLDQLLSEIESECDIFSSHLQGILNPRRNTLNLIILRKQDFTSEFLMNLDNVFIYDSKNKCYCTGSQNHPTYIAFDRNVPNGAMMVFQDVAFSIELTRITQNSTTIGSYLDLNSIVEILEGQNKGEQQLTRIRAALCFYDAPDEDIID